MHVPESRGNSCKASDAGPHEEDLNSPRLGREGKGMMISITEGSALSVGVTCIVASLTIARSSRGEFVECVDFGDEARERRNVADFQRVFEIRKWHRMPKRKKKKNAGPSIWVGVSSSHGFWMEKKCEKMSIHEESYIETEVRRTCSVQGPNTDKTCKRTR